MSTAQGFTYLAHDLRTNVQLAELPLEGVDFSTRLKSIGNMSANIGLSTEKAPVRFDPRDIVNATRPTRTAIYVDWNGQLVWGGILWGREYDSDNATLSITCEEFFSFYQRHFYHQTSPAEINLPLRFVQQDQFEIFRNLIWHAEFKNGGDIGFEYPNAMSGVLRDRTYRVTKYKQIYEALDELSNVINGFDYAIELYYANDRTPRKRLALNYPRRGRRNASTAVMWEFPGEIQKFTWPEDGSGMATRSHAQGAGEGREMLRSFKTNTTLINAGWPLLEQHYAYTDITVQSTLDGHAQADLDAADQPVTMPTITIPIDGDYPLGSFIEGDHARVRLFDDRFPEQYDALQRIIGWTVRPEEGNMTIEFARIDPAL